MRGCEAVPERVRVPEEVVMWAAVRHRLVPWWNGGTVDGNASSNHKIMDATPARRMSTAHALAGSLAALSAHLTAVRRRSHRMLTPTE